LIAREDSTDFASELTIRRISQITLKQAPILVKASARKTNKSIQLSVSAGNHVNSSTKAYLAGSSKNMASVMTVGAKKLDPAHMIRFAPSSNWSDRAQNQGKTITLQNAIKNRFEEGSTIGIIETPVAIQAVPNEYPSQNDDK
jgi:hypothetical protein